MRFIDKNFFLIVPFFAATIVTLGDVPWKTSFQGRLLHGDGNPVSSNVTVDIRIYPSSLGGLAAYTETIGSVPVINGLYSFEFGTNSLSFMTALAGEQAWLEVSLNGVPTQPRHRLLASPYAMVAGSLQAPHFTFANGAYLFHNGVDLFLVSTNGSVTNRITNNANIPPTAVADSTNTPMDTPVVINILDNDTDADGDSILLVGFTQPASGSVVSSGVSSVQFTPAASFTGSVSFTYSIKDARGAAATGTVQVVVNSAQLYMIVDVSGGSGAASYPVTYQASAPTDLLTNNAYKTTKIVLRRIPAGSFVMGSAPGEAGRASVDDDETQHNVTLTKAFYMGVFEITQSQYQNVTGANPSEYGGAMRPVETVSFTGIRGGTWPGGNPGGSTFFGLLRTKTGGIKFDLPTEAQWEYACRAGTTTSLNSGNNLVNPSGSDVNANTVAWYYFNAGVGGHQQPGLKAPNAWGLYDMHGNVYEWVLDWYGAYGGSVTDPAGPASGPQKVVRGGSTGDPAENVRSADRYVQQVGGAAWWGGFRAGVQPD